MHTSAGMMPTLQRRGVTSPGPLGPMSSVLRRSRWEMTSAMSRAGMSSVTQTMSRMPPSAASIMASRAKPAGTKTTETSGLVCSMASATVSNTGTPLTSWPARPGDVPATTLVPAARMRTA